MTKSSELWFVLYTTPRAEKKVATRLEQLSYTVYLPVVEQLKQWSDRKKKVEVVLFPSYLFIYGTKDKVVTTLGEPGIVKFVNFKGNYATIREEEIASIKRLIATGVRFETENQLLDKGDEVIIQDGPLKGISGKVLSIQSETDFYLQIDSIGYNMKMKIPGRYLIKK